VGEEGEVLEDETDGTGSCREPGVVCSIEPDFVIDADEAGVCVGEAGEDAEDGGLASTGGAVEGEEASFFQLKIYVEELDAGCGVEGFPDF